MTDSLLKLRESMTKEPQPQGGHGPENREQAGGPVRGDASGKTKKKRSIVLPVLLIVMGCAVFLFAAWSAVNSPVFASIMNFVSAPQTQPQADLPSFAQVDIAKPTYTPAVQLVAQEILPTATFTTVPPTATLTEVPPATDIPPTDLPPTATAEPEVTSSDEGTSDEATSEFVAIAEIVPDTPTPEYVAPTAAPNVPAAVSGNGERWIDVDLSEQRLYAYEGDTLVRSFVVSTGTWQTPTVTGKYRVWIKLRSAPMSGPGYYLPDVPYIMYFYKGYGIHGTYWHNNFGTPMSHGCVNMTIADAEWVYNFSVVGTVVNVHH